MMIRNEKLQHDVNREAAKIYKYKYLKVKKDLPQTKEERLNKLSLQIFLSVKHLKTKKGN